MKKMVLYLSTVTNFFTSPKGCSESTGDDEDEDEEEFDWQVEQEVYKETSEEELRAMQTYGFGNQRSGVFTRLQVRLQIKTTSSSVKSSHIL